MKVAILDFGVGNVRTLTKALEAGGGEVMLETDAAVAAGADALVLPAGGGLGVATAVVGGAAPALRAALLGGLPCLAIGTGMHLLFEADATGAAGLGLIRGHAGALEAQRVPHVGWNLAESSGAGADALLDGVSSPFFYFAHSAIAFPAELPDVQAEVEHGGKRFPAIVRRGATWGLQFRPEKSGGAGLRLIRNFLNGIRA